MDFTYVFEYQKCNSRTFEANISTNAAMTSHLVLKNFFFKLTNKKHLLTSYTQCT